MLCVVCVLEDNERNLEIVSEKTLKNQQARGSKNSEGNYNIENRPRGPA